ncbi:MAG TPA: flavodoxin [Chloroflexi bacterium]|nr:flavodoxin [Chloroflexota bacterium]HPO59330.1 flavodoxin domain-containing protein [Anaerolineaceae bacterium]
MSARKLSRRAFLKTAGLALGASALACGGLGIAASRRPEIDFIQSTYGKENPVGNHVLITYATKAGSTAEVADVIGQTLAARGFQVDVRPVRDNPSLDGYQAVIVGSPIRMGNWLDEAVEFVRANQARMSGMPAALFTVHLENLANDENSRAARQAYTAPLRELLPGASEAFFAGNMDPAKLPLIERLLVRAMASQTGLPVGDQRDWEQIRAWANEVFA